MLDGCTPWPPEFAEAYRRAGYWRGQTLGDLLHAWAHAYGGSPAVASGGEHINYRSLAGRADRLAFHLRKLGIERGDRVVVQLGERICAYVIPRPGEAVTLEALRAFLEAKGIARFKLPERLEVVDSFPMTSVGKINKMALREDIAGKVHAKAVTA